MWAVLLAPLAFVLGPAYAGAAALVGLVPGFAGYVVGQKSSAAAAAILLFLGVVIFSAAPSPLVGWTGAVLLCLGCVTEAHRAGGRAFVLALYGWCALVLSPDLLTEQWVPLCIGAGLLWGALSARWLHLSALAAQPAAPLPTAVMLGVFLLAGVIVTKQLAAALDPTYGYWVVLLFVMRALSPPERSLGRALRYGLGAVLGSGVAFALALTDPPPQIALAGAFALCLAGLRVLPHPGPWSAAAFTSAVLLLLPIGTDGIFLRVEAALLAVALTLALVGLIGLGWSLLARVTGTPTQAPTR